MHSPTFRPAAATWFAVALAASCLFPSATLAKTLESEIRAYPARGVSLIRVDMPVGQIRIEGSDSDKVRAQVLAHCDRSARACDAQVQKLKYTGNMTGSTLNIGVDDVPTMDSDGFHIELIVQIPRALALEIKMNAGEVDVEGMEGHVDVNLRVGEANVRMPERTVRRASVDVMIGEASIDRRGDVKNHSGLFVRKVRMDDGPGLARVDVNVGIGEACLKLQ